MRSVRIDGHPLTRRRFVQNCTTAVIVQAAAPQMSWALDHAGGRSAETWGCPDDIGILADSARMKALALHAVDAAKTAGAQYAEAHLSRAIHQLTVGLDGAWWESGQVVDTEYVAIGVRCLIDGCWGFAASPFWTLDDAAQLAASAVAQAKAGAKGKPGQVELGSPISVTGDWRMPVEIDPFTVPIEERKDFAQALELWCSGYKITGEFSAWLRLELPFTRTELATATSEGATYSQTLWSTPWGPGIKIIRNKNSTWRSDIDIPFRLPSTPSWRGWELMRDTRFTEQIPQLFDEGKEILSATAKPGEPNRYDVVFDAYTMGSLLGQSLGAATELDRILGYEANAGGTSFLGTDPLAMIGTSKVASSAVTITANRSLPGGLATTKWDAEGVEPSDVTLVKSGVLTDLQTTREFVSALTPYYQRVNHPMHSNGFAAHESALFPPMVMRPNLTLQPVQEDVSMTALIKTMKKGLAVFYGNASGMDFQGRTGVIGGLVREVVDGQIGKVITGAAFLIDSTALWKRVQAVGGASSLIVTDHGQTKGQPKQSTRYTIQAVPALVTEVTLINPYRPV